MSEIMNTRLCGLLTRAQYCHGPLTHEKLSNLSPIWARLERNGCPQGSRMRVYERLISVCRLAVRFPLSECLQPEIDCREKVLLDAHCSLPQVWEVGVRNKLRWRGSAAVEPHLLMLYCPCVLPLFFPLPLYPASTPYSPVP